MPLWVKKYNQAHGNSWASAQNLWVKTGRSPSTNLWEKVQKVWVKTGSYGVQAWPKSGPYTTTSPYISSNTAGTQFFTVGDPIYSYASDGTTSVVAYGQIGTWKPNVTSGHSSVLTYSYETKTATSSSSNVLTSVISPTTISSSYASIPISNSAYDGKYLIFIVNATNSAGIVGSDDTDSGKYRYLICKRQPKILPGYAKILSDTSTSTYSFSYTSEWDGTPGYTPDSSKSNVLWYSSTNGSLTIDQVQNSSYATLLTGGITTSTPTTNAGVYMVTSTFTQTASTIVDGTYFYAIDTQQNSYSLFSGTTYKQYAVSDPIYTKPVVVNSPTISAQMPGNYGGSTSSFTVGATISGYTGTYNPAANGPAPVTYSFEYATSSGGSGNFFSLTDGTQLFNKVDSTQGQTHTFVLPDTVQPIFGNPVSTVGKYLFIETFAENGSISSTVNAKSSNYLIHSAPHITNIGGMTFSQTDGSLSITSLSFPDSTTSYYYQLQWAPYQGSWTNMGSIKYQTSLSLIGYSYLKYTSSDVPYGNYYYRILAYNDDGVYIASSSIYGPVNTVRIPTNATAPYWTDTSNNAVSSPYLAGTYRLHFGTWNNTPTYYNYQIYYNNQAGTIITQDYNGTYTQNYVDYTFPINTNTIGANVYAGNSGGLSALSYPSTIGPMLGTQSAPTLGTPVPTITGFYVSITNYDSNATYTVNQINTTSTSTPSFSVGSTIYVSNTSPSSSTTITVTASKTGYANATSNSVTGTTIAQPGAFTYSIIDTSANRGPGVPVVTYSVLNNTLYLDWATTQNADQYREYLNSGPVAHTGYYPGGSTSTFTSDSWSFASSGTESITFYAYNTLNGQVSVSYGGSSGADYYQILYSVGGGTAVLSSNLTGNLFPINASIGTAVTIFSVVAYNNAGGNIGGTTSSTNPFTPTTKSASTTNTYSLTYVPPSYTITWSANGGSVTPTSTIAASGTNISAPTPTRTNYTFLYWRDTLSQYSFAYQINPGGTWNVTGNQTFYAWWQLIQYTVTYNANGGTVSPTSSVVDSGTSVTLPTPTRSGYTFNGWYNAASGGTLIGAAGASYTPSAAITLYAQWTIVPSNPKISSISYVPLGNFGTLYTSASANFTGNTDDGYWTFVLPYTITYNGTVYDKIYVGTNSYITFGSGSTVYSPSASNPAFDKILVWAADRSSNSVYWYSTSSVWNIKLNCGLTSGTPGTGIQWELYNSNANGTKRLDVTIVAGSGGTTTAASSSTSFSSLGGNGTAWSITSQ